jgi:hypothetical protein
MWLPVLNGANKPMKSKSYTYKVKKYNRDRNAKIEYIDKKVEAADMFAVNTTIMRCLVKNLAMFGPFKTGNHISLVILLIVTFVKHIKPVSSPSKYGKFVYGSLVTSYCISGNAINTIFIASVQLKYE